MTVFERIHYFAAPGLEAKVLRTRLEASRIRVELGLPRGNVRRRGANSDPGPDVVWECAFADFDAQQADLTVRDQSTAFQQIRSQMDLLLADSARLVEISVSEESELLASDFRTA